MCEGVALDEVKTFPNTLLSFTPDIYKAVISAVEFIETLFISTHSTVGNNTISNIPVGTFLVDSNNETINGNYYTNTSQDALRFNHADNVTIYHNDFVNYTGISEVGIKNIKFNLSYPIGGNYWSNISGHYVDQKSGPGQNMPGSDGINDGAFSPAANLTDYYPLVHKWTRPQIVFNAPSGINGTTWKVTFNGQTKQSTNDTITFNILNGTYQQYSYSYYNSTLYYTNSPNGNFSYVGSGVSINVPYFHYSYITGHLNLSNYTLYINGKQITVENGSFNLTVTAGSYDVVISSTGYLTYNHTYNVSPGEILNVSPTLGKNNPGSVPISSLTYAIAAVAVIAVAGGTWLYMRGRRKK